MWGADRCCGRLNLWTPTTKRTTKFDFYAAHGVEEIIVADPAARVVRLFRFEASGYVPAAASGLLGATADQLTAVNCRSPYAEKGPLAKRTRISAVRDSQIDPRPADATESLCRGIGRRGRRTGCFFVRLSDKRVHDELEEERTSSIHGSPSGGTSHH